MLVSPISIDLPVTHNIMIPSSCNSCMGKDNNSSSLQVPYGNDICISHAGSEIIAANLPNIEKSKHLTSQLIH